MKYEITEEEFSRLGNNFTYHAPKNPCQVSRYEDVRSNAKNLAHMLYRLCPSSRELLLAMTKLEEVVFWANAAIARNE